MSHLKLFPSLSARLTLIACLASLLLVSESRVSAQFGPKPPSGPSLHGANAKLFGDNSAFSAVMEMTTRDGADEVIVPGKIAFNEGMNRFEMDISEIKGKNAKGAKDAKAMGMDKMINITRPDRKVTYSVWPGFQSYLENPLTESSGSTESSEFKMEVTSLGKETVEGHECEKNKVVVTDKNGEKHESLVWNATDLKRFPIKIESVHNGQTMRMLFKDVQLGKPSADLFEPPAGFKRYNNMQDMMMTEMMKQKGEARDAVDSAAAEGNKAKEKEKDGKKIKEIFRKKVLPF